MRGTVMPLIMIALGIAIVVRTITAGGGPATIGILVGILFVAAGAGRMYVERRHHRDG